MVVPRYVKKDVLLLQLYTLTTELERDIINWDDVIDNGIVLNYPVSGVSGCYMYKIPWLEGGYTVVFINPLTGTIVKTMNDDQLGNTFDSW